MDITKIRPCHWTKKLAKITNATAATSSTSTTISRKKSKAISREIAKTVRWSNKKTWKSSNKAFGEDWRLRKIGNSFAFELSKIENDCNVWNLKNEDKVEIVYEPRRDNIFKKAVVEDTKPKSSWDKFTGGNKLGRQ